MRFQVSAKFNGANVTQKRPPLWLNTDLDPYLRAQDDSTSQNADVRNGQSGHRDNREECLQERRKSARKFLSGFAVVHTLDPDGRKGRYRLAQLLDISTTGIGLRLNATDPHNFVERREFEILFQFSDNGKPLHMACTACRKALDDAGVIIGAMFRNSLESLDEVSC